MWCSTPVLLPLPLLPVWAGLPEGSQTFEAEGSRVGPPPKLGGHLDTEGMGERSKASPQPWLGWRECSTAIKRH